MKKQIFLFLVLLVTVIGCYAQPTTDQKADYFTVKRVPAVNNISNEILVRNTTTGRIEKTSKQSLVNQDNIFLVKSAILPDDTPSNAEILSTINTLPAYTVSETNNVIFSLSYHGESGELYLFKFILVNKGKSVYGFANIQCDLNDIELVYHGKASQQDILEIPSTEIFNYGNITGTISNWVNSQEAILIQSQGDGYTIINATISGVAHSWLFTGTGGKYGIGFEQTNDLDFQLFGSILDSATPDLSNYQLISNIQQNMNSSATKYPSVDAVRVALGDKQDNLPNQSGNAGKVLGTNGSTMSWTTVGSSGGSQNLQQVTNTLLDNNGYAVTTNGIKAEKLRIGGFYSDGYSFGSDYDAFYNFSYQPFIGCQLYDGTNNSYWHPSGFGISSNDGLYGTFLDLGSIIFHNNSNLSGTLIGNPNLTTYVNYTLPPSTGTLALTSDILAPLGLQDTTDIDAATTNLVSLKGGFQTESTVSGSFYVTKNPAFYDTFSFNSTDVSNIFGAIAVYATPEEGFNVSAVNGDYSSGVSSIATGGTTIGSVYQGKSTSISSFNDKILLYAADDYNTIINQLKITPTEVSINGTPVATIADIPPKGKITVTDVSEQAFTDLASANSWLTQYTSATIADESYSDHVYKFTVPANSDFSLTNGFCGDTTNSVKFEDPAGLVILFGNSSFSNNIHNNILGDVTFGASAFKNASPPIKNTINKIITCGSEFAFDYVGEMDVNDFGVDGVQNLPNDFFTTGNFAWIITDYSNKFNNSGGIDGDLVVAEINMTGTNSTISYDGIDSGGSGITEAPNDGLNYARNSLGWSQIISFPEASSDSKYYSRRNGIWVQPTLTNLDFSGGNTLFNPLIVNDNSGLNLNNVALDGFYARGYNLTTSPWAYLKKNGLYLKTGTSSGKVEVLLTGNANQTVSGTVFQPPVKSTAGTYTLATSDDLPTYTTNPTTTGLSTSMLNSTYPNAKAGDKIVCTSIVAGKMVYECTAASTWIGYTVLVP